MSGGGGDNVLGTVLSVGAAIAAPELAPVIFGEGAGIGAVMGTGALLGGAANAVTGRDPLQGALMGGAGAGLNQALAGPGGILGQMGTAPGISGDTTLSGIANAGGATPSSVNDPISNLYDTGALSGGAGDTTGAVSRGISGGTGAPTLGANGLTDIGKYALIGGGGLALLSAMNKENSKYGVPPNNVANEVPSNLRYALTQHAPMNLSRSYAEGGPIEPNSLNGGPIKQKLSNISTGDNQMYPQPGLHSNEYANPANTPVPGNVLTAATDTSVDPYTGQQRMAGGGIAHANLGGYAAGGNPHLLKGPGDGMSDNIPATISGKQPARLADGEFVVPADVVSHLGNGSTDAGAKKLHTMMDNVRKARTGRKSQGKEIKADKYMPKFADGGQVDPIAAAAQNAQAANQGLQNANTVNNAYATILNRSADPSGQAFWNQQLNSGAQTPQTLAQNFTNSPEMAQNMATQTGTPQQNFINSLYQTNTGRAPDVAGNAAWNTALNNGATPEQIQQGIANSAEAQKYKAMQAITNPTMADQMAAYRNDMLYQYSPTNENFLKQQYLQQFGRAPDAAGLANWTKAMQDGMTPQQVAQAISQSPEAARVNNIRSAMGQTTPANAALGTTEGMTNSAANDLIQSVYQGNLGRAAEQAGVDYWSGKLRSGAITSQQFIDAVKGSDEFKNKGAATTTTNTSNTGYYVDPAGHVWSSLDAYNAANQGATGGLGSTIRKRKKA